MKKRLMELMPLVAALVLTIGSMIFADSRTEDPYIPMMVWILNLAYICWIGFRDYQLDKAHRKIKMVQDLYDQLEWELRSSVFGHINHPNCRSNGVYFGFDKGGDPHGSVNSKAASNDLRS